jgi:hypothetical protein
MITRILVAMAICAALLTWFRWQTAVPIMATTHVAMPLTSARVVAVADRALDEAEDLTVSNDPFRLSNTPPSVRYDPANDGSALGPGTIAPPPFRPTLVLKAIVGGPPWQAVIDGIPGQPAGTIARQGATFDKLTVRSVTRDSVIVQGPDTAWTLSFRGR